MKNPLLRARALERLYQKTLRLLREDEAKFDIDPFVDSEQRAKEFVASMSGSTQRLLIHYIEEWYHEDALHEFLWLMPPVPDSLGQREARRVQ